MSMRNTNRLLALSVMAALSGAQMTTAQAPDRAGSSRPTAFTNARIYTVSGEMIETGTLVIKNGKIEAVGKDVVVPAGAKVIDASGKTIMPGLVSAWSAAGLAAPPSRSNTPQRGSRRGRTGAPTNMGSSGGSTSNNAATKVIDSIYTRQTIFAELLEAGITSLALTPQGGGFPGLGAVLNPAGKSRDDLAIDDEAFVQIGMQRNTGAKKALTDMFDKAKKVVEEREKPPAPPEPEKQPEAAKPEGKPGDAPAGKPPEGKPAEGKPPEGKEPPKPTPTPAPAEGDKKQDPKPAEAKKAPPEKPKDPNVEVIADLLQGKRRAIVQIDSAADLLHWRTAVKDDVKFPRMVAVMRHDSNSGTIDMVTEHLKAWQCSVLLPAALTTLPRSSHLTNPAKTLHDAGIEIGFAIGESTNSVRSIFFDLMELIRSGLPADVALKAITLVPAKALGIDKRTGTLEAGKDADLLVFDVDPLSPVGKLEQVWLRGTRVENQ